MRRLLVLDVDVFGQPDLQGLCKRHVYPWVPSFAETLRRSPDVGLVLHSSRKPIVPEPGRHLLGELQSRVVGSTFGFLGDVGLEEVLRVHQGPLVPHLVVVKDGAHLSPGRFNVLECGDAGGLLSQTTQAAVAAWIARTTKTPSILMGTNLPKGLGMPVLYLDFDGVLHHENVMWHPRRGVYAGPPGFVLFEHAELLHWLLAPYPEIRIVLSTSWVRTYGCYGTAKRLPEGLRRRVVGATFHSEMYEPAFVAKPRGQQVLEDVARRRPKNWLAIDDTDEGWPSEVREHVLLTDEQLGIGAPGMPEKLVAALKRLMASSSK